MVAYATFSDVSVAYEGSIPSGRQTWVENLIERATTKLIAEVPKLTDPSLVPPAWPIYARDAIVAAVCRVIRNPMGAKNQVAGPFTLGLNDSASTGELLFTDGDLAPFKSPSRRKVGMVGVAPPRWTT